MLPLFRAVIRKAFENESSTPLCGFRACAFFIRNFFQDHERPTSNVVLASCLAVPRYFTLARQWHESEVDIYFNIRLVFMQRTCKLL